MRSILIFALLSISILTSAQKTITGRIKSINGNGIEYVNIGILEKNTGTVSDVNGIFNINIPDSLVNDSLTIRHINFQTISLCIRDLSFFKENEITLNHKENILPDIVILSQKRKYKWISKGIRIPGYAEPNYLGEEFGIVINVSEFNAISKCKFNISSCKYDSVIFRFNVYLSEKLEPAYSRNITIYKDNKNKQYEIPLSIPLEQEKNLFVSLEYAYSYGKGGLKFPIFLGKSFCRKTSLDNFTEVPIRMGFSIETIKFE